MTSGRRSLVLWSSLVIAFSPVIHDLGRSLVANPEQRYTLLPLVLAAIGLVLESRVRSDSRAALGSGAIVLGLVAELVGIASNSWFIARVGFPIAIFGTGLVLGHRLLYSIPLLYAAIPVPEFLVYSTSPFLESMLARLAGEVVALTGGSIEVGGPLITSRGRRLELLGYDSGIVTAILLAATGWYAAFRLGLGWFDCVGRSAVAAAGTVVLQPLLVLVSAFALAWGAPFPGGLILRYGATIGLGLWAILRFPAPWPKLQRPIRS